MDDKFEDHDVEEFELCNPEPASSVPRQVSLSVDAAYPAFEKRLKNLPRLSYDPATQKLVLAADENGAGQDPAEQLAVAFGLTHKDAAILLASLAVKSVVSTKDAGCEQTANAVLGLIADSEPQDAIEAMVVSLIAASTIHASKAMAQAVNKRQSAIESKWVADPMAVPIRLMNCTSKLVEALSRYRRRGEQRILVNHISVS